MKALRQITLLLVVGSPLFFIIGTGRLDRFAGDGRRGTIDATTDGSESAMPGVPKDIGIGNASRNRQALVWPKYFRSDKWVALARRDHAAIFHDLRDAETKSGFDGLNSNGRQTWVANRKGDVGGAGSTVLELNSDLLNRQVWPVQQEQAALGDSGAFVGCLSGPLRLSRLPDDGPSGDDSHPYKTHLQYVAGRHGRLPTKEEFLRGKKFAPTQVGTSRVN